MRSIVVGLNRLIVASRANVRIMNEGNQMKNCGFWVWVIGVMISQSVDASPPTRSLQCYQEAVEWLGAPGAAATLCSGAISRAPLDCAKEAFEYFGALGASIRLCTLAQSNAPVDCAIIAHEWLGAPGASIDLCIRAKSEAPVDCAKNAYALTGAINQSIRLCRVR
ncbi:MAG: hypothetical protein EOP09_18145 [Proteobacteria bacterium]|nr:MAG: hypothetical protein EOP09_18145 [Pseudomonadota bacterium]